MTTEVPSWLLGLPQRWGLARGRTMAQLIQRPASAQDSVVTAFRDGQVTLRSNRRADGFTQAIQETGYQGVRTGELAIHSMDGFAGAMGVSDSDGKMSPVVHIYAVPNDCPYYLAYALRVAARCGFIQSLAKGIRERSTSFDKPTFKDMLLPRPPRDEQEAIVAYLDCETARIDTLIEEQQRLIEMLNERRRSVVDRAIGGLDSEACWPTNDPWWPELPDGWYLLSLRRVIRDLADGPHFSPNYVDDGVMFLSARNIKVDGWALDDAKFVSEDDYQEFSKRVVPELGDVLYTKGGTTGIARAVDLDVPFQVWVHVAVLKVRHDVVDPFFLAYALNSAPCYDQSQLFTRGATNNDLGLTRMVNITLPVPPVEKQRQIVADLDKQTSKIDTLIEESVQLIELARERRSALITAAVTGQIDVREVA